MAIGRHEKSIMKWIAIKHPITWAFEISCHQVLVPQVPPIPPMPPSGTPKPAWPHAVPHHIPPGEMVWGKWTDASSVAQNMGVCLWQHDWGLGQVHITVPVSPALALILLGSTLKLQLPSSSQKLKATGGAVAKGDDVPPAPAFPCGVIVAQGCHDISGKGFTLPTAVHISPVCTVFLDVKTGDIWAGVCATAADALNNLAASYFGGRWGGAAGVAIGNIMGTFGRTKMAGLFLGFPTALWDSLKVLQLRPNRLPPKAVKAAIEGRGRASAGFMVLTIASIACDVAADAFQGTGSSVGEEAPKDSSPKPQ
jgi:hypothetical protein